MDSARREVRPTTFPRLLLFAGLVLSISGFLLLPRRQEPKWISVRPAGERVAMPVFAWPSLSGVRWDLEQQRGKIVFVNFWATWCGPCRQETPDLVRVYEKYRSRGVMFAGVSMDDRPGEVVPRFARRYRVEYPILVPSNNSPLIHSIATIPTSFLLDGKGRVARAWAKIVYESELTRNIEELLTEQSAAARVTQ